MMTLDSKKLQAKVENIFGNTFELVYDTVRNVKDNDDEIKAAQAALNTLILRKIYADTNCKRFSSKISKKLFEYVAEGDEIVYKHLLKLTLRDGKLTQGTVLSDGIIKDRHIVYLDSVAKAASFLMYLLKLKDTMKTSVSVSDADAISAAKTDIEKSLRLAPLSKMISCYCRKHKEISEHDLRCSYLADFNSVRTELKKAALVKRAKAKTKTKK